ncbi:MAG: hypothetical protein QOI31_2156 [Solirubrobacterales bacterium]|jgi:hypothetical protein|nr:hypothetical protein [Solirubrobacterales bacterium]
MTSSGSLLRVEEAIFGFIGVVVGVTMSFLFEELRVRRKERQELRTAARLAMRDFHLTRQRLKKAIESKEGWTAWEASASLRSSYEPVLAFHMGDEDVWNDMWRVLGGIDVVYGDYKPGQDLSDSEIESLEGILERTRKAIRVLRESGAAGKTKRRRAGESDELLSISFGLRGRGITIALVRAPRAKA